MEKKRSAASPNAAKRKKNKVGDTVTDNVVRGGGVPVAGDGGNTGGKDNVIRGTNFLNLVKGLNAEVLSGSQEKVIHLD